MPKVKPVRKHRISVHPYKSKDTEENEFNDDSGRGNSKRGSFDSKGSSSTAEPSDEEPPKRVGLSRGQKKRLQNKERIQIKLGIVPIDSKMKVIKPAAGPASADSGVKQMLSELESSLISESDNSQAIKPASVNIVTSNKMKHQIAVREAARMKLVQKHPSFVGNPLAAMRAHLEQVVSMKEAEKAQK